MDHVKRVQLIEAIRQQGLPSADAPLPIVTLEQFFDGNDDLGSIGCNLTKHPGIEFFHNTLRTIRDRSNVKDVLVEIYEVEEDEDSMWPLSERVFVVTTAPQEEVELWFTDLEP